MKKIMLVLLSASFLTGCGSKEDANEANFSAAFNTYFEKQDELCFRIGQSFPVEIEFKPKYPTLGGHDKFQGLVATGLVAQEDILVNEEVYFQAKGLPDKKVQGKRYSLTDAGKSVFKEDSETKSSGGKICYGKKSLDKVVKWELGDSPFGKYTRITYLYKIDNLASWAKNPEFLATRRDVAQEIEGIGKEKSRNAVLTNLGWEIK